MHQTDEPNHGIEACYREFDIDFERRMMCLIVDMNAGEVLVCCDP